MFPIGGRGKGVKGLGLVISNFPCKYPAPFSVYLIFFQDHSTIFSPWLGAFLFGVPAVFNCPSVSSYLIYFSPLLNSHQRDNFSPVSLKWPLLLFSTWSCNCILLLCKLSWNMACTEDAMQNKSLLIVLDPLAVYFSLPLSLTQFQKAFLANIASLSLAEKAGSEFPLQFLWSFLQYSASGLPHSLML